MMNNLLNNFINSELIENISGKTGISTEQINGVVNNILPNIDGFINNENLGQLTDSISSKTGIATETVSKVLGALTPILGELTKNNDLGSIGNSISNFLDKGKDGSVIDDISEMFLGKSNPLSGLFGK